MAHQGNRVLGTVNHARHIGIRHNVSASSHGGPFSARGTVPTMGQRHSGGGGRGTADNGQLGRFRSPLFDEAGNVLAKALGVSRGWSEVQGTTELQDASSSVQRPASRSRSSVLGSATCGVVRCVWCRSVDERLSHSEAGMTSALVRGEPRAFYWSEPTALYARTITFAAYSNGRQACPQG